MRIDGNRIEIAQVFVFFRGDAGPVLSRVFGAINAIGSARDKNVRIGRRFGNGANYKPFKTNELPGMAGVSAAVNAPAMGTERPTRGIKRICRARIHNHGHDHVVVMLANSSEQFPVFSRIAGAKHVPVRSAEEKRARVARHSCEGLDVSTGRANLPPGLGVGRK